MNTSHNFEEDLLWAKMDLSLSIILHIYVIYKNVYKLFASVKVPFPSTRIKLDQSCVDLETRLELYLWWESYFHRRVLNPSGSWKANTLPFEIRPLLRKKEFHKIGDNSLMLWWFKNLHKWIGWVSILAWLGYRKVWRSVTKKLNLIDTRLPPLFTTEKVHNKYCFLSNMADYALSC